MATVTCWSLIVLQDKPLDRTHNMADVFWHQNGFPRDSPVSTFDHTSPLNVETRK